MRIWTTLAAIPLALTVTLGLNGGGASAQADCQSRLAAIEAFMSTSEEQGSADISATGTPIATDTEGTSGGAAIGDDSLAVELAQAQILCAHGQDAEANDTLTHIEAIIISSGEVKSDGTTE